MSELLIELGLEESIEDWLKEMRWKRNNDYMAFQSALEECRVLAREEVEATAAEERARCLEIVNKACAKAAKTQCERAEKHGNST